MPVSDKQSILKIIAHNHCHNSIQAVNINNSWQLLILMHIMIRLIVALLVYCILAVELDGLGQTVTLAPLLLDAVSTVMDVVQYGKINGVVCFIN